jgi:DNA invertase Pin-like site-specific DNA recombinase
MNATKNVYSYIRWSTERQNWGDSERRQEQLAKDWCDRKGLKLSGRSFADRGTSAWKGKNREAGALGDLIKIAKSGDVVLIEDNDRFSREDTITAMNNLHDMVGKGITVVFLKTGLEVTTENFNDPAVLFLNIFQSYLANAESVKKAYRVKQSWDARKAAVKSGKPINQNLPSWLKWDREKDKIIVLEEKSAVVRRMFDLYLEGGSTLYVARQLVNESAVHVSKQRSRGWGHDYVHRTLTNKAVLGYCLHVNPPVSGIYPAIVDEQKFWAVQAKLGIQRRSTVHTKYADSNLFTGLVHCSKCGNTLSKHNQQRHGRVYRYLVCSAALHGTTNCGLSSIRYELLEKSFLSLLAEAELVHGTMGQDKPADRALDALKGRLSEAEKQVERIMRLIEGEDEPPKRLLERLKEFEVEETKLREQVEAETNKAKATPPLLQAYAQFKTEFAMHMQERDFRVRFKKCLRDIVEKITVHLGQDLYQVHFKGAKQAITVEIGSNDSWCFSPAPSWVFGLPVPQDGNIIG